MDATSSFLLITYQVSMRQEQVVAFLADPYARQFNARNGLRDKGWAGVKAIPHTSWAFDTYFLTLAGWDD
jgi:hypothetical protein